MTSYNKMYFLKEVELEQFFKSSLSSLCSLGSNPQINRTVVLPFQYILSQSCLLYIIQFLTYGICTASTHVERSFSNKLYSRKVIFLIYRSSICEEIKQKAETKSFQSQQNTLRYKTFKWLLLVLSNLTS